MDLKDLRLEHFAGLVGEIFRAQLDGENVVELELTEAKPAAGERAGSAFSIVFTGSLDTYLEQRIYDLEHGELGKISIFLVPIGRGKDGFLYEAVFTRLEEEATP